MRRRLRSVDYEPGPLRRAWRRLMRMFGVRTQSVCPRCHGIGAVWAPNGTTPIVCRVCDGLGTTME